jgi:hypothetical protein
VIIVPPVAKDKTVRFGSLKPGDVFEWYERQYLKITPFSATDEDGDEIHLNCIDLMFNENSTLLYDELVIPLDATLTLKYKE